MASTFFDGDTTIQYDAAEQGSLSQMPLDALSTPTAYEQQQVCGGPGRYGL